MAYSRENAINTIVDYKRQWADANAAGDTNAQNEAAKNAQEYYAQLTANGDEAIANELTAADYTEAQRIKNKYATMGKTETRPYMYSLGKKYGLTENQVDALIGWDEKTGEISFGGKKIGQPDALVGGASYWTTTDQLDSAFTDYVTRSGLTPSASTMVSQGNMNLTNKQNELYDTIMNENPFETEVGKSVMGKYNLAAIQGRENQLASGAATNGGNIDSFSAANALRQQAALIYQGQDAVLAAQQQKIDNAKSILESMGVHIDRMYEQDETTKNNEVSRNVAISDVTGKVPTSWQIKNDPILNMYLNEDGTVKEQYINTDFQEMINNTTDPAIINSLSIVRTMKMLGNPEYMKWWNDGNKAILTPQQTEGGRQFDAQIASSEKIATEGYKSNETIANTNAETALKQTELQEQGATERTNIEAQTTKDIASMTPSEEGEEYETLIDLGDGKTAPIGHKMSDASVNNLVKDGKISNAYGVDTCGQALIKAVRDDIISNHGGVILIDDTSTLIELIANHSAECDTNVAQIQCVLNYLFGAEGDYHIDASAVLRNKSDDYRDGVYIYTGKNE